MISEHDRDQVMKAYLESFKVWMSQNDLEQLKYELLKQLDFVLFDYDSTEALRAALARLGLEDIARSKNRSYEERLGIINRRIGLIVGGINRADTSNVYLWK